MVDTILIEVPSEPSIVEVSISNPIVEVGLPIATSLVEVAIQPDVDNITVTEIENPTIVEIFDPYHLNNLVPHRYTHTQLNESRTWVVTHHLNTQPVLNIVVNGENTGCRISYPSLDSAIIEFNQPCSGKAYAIG